MDFKKHLPIIYVIVFFLVATIVYFMPLYQGKSIRSHDITQFQGMAKEIDVNRKNYNEEPFWTAAQFSGMPTTMISADHYGNLIRPLHNFISNIIKYPGSLIFIALVSFFVLMLALDVPYLIAGLAAIGFAFGSFNFIGLVAGHNAKLACIAYTPAVLAGMVWAYRKNLWLGASILGFALAMQINNNHVQITYYLAFICVSYAIVELFHFVKNKNIFEFSKISALLLVAAAIAIGTNAGHFLSLNEYGKYSIRGKVELKPLAENKEAVRKDGLDRDYVFNYSSSLTEPMTFLIADYFGGASTGNLGLNSSAAQALKENGADMQQIRGFVSQVPLYFGEQPYVAGPFYIGAIICFLFVFGMLVVSDKIKWAMLACAVLGTLLMLGKNFTALNYTLFDYFPLYNKFRAVTMAVIIPQICMAVVVGLGLKTFFESKDKLSYQKPLIISFASTAGLALLVYVFAGASSYSSPSDYAYQLPDWLISALSEDRKSIRTTDALRTFFYILLAGATLFAVIKNKLSNQVALYLLFFLTLLDLWLIDKRYLNDNQFAKNQIQEFYTPTEADSYILQDKNPNYRVLNLDNPFNESRTSYFHKSIGGYSPAKLRRYQDLIERKLSLEMQSFIDGLKSKELRFHQTPVLNMLNTKYIMAGSEAQSVIQNDSALGNAWFVKEIVAVNNPDQEMEEVGMHNPKNTAIVDGSRFKVEQVHFIVDSNAYVQQKNYKPYDIEYESNSKNTGFVVFSEVFYPKGWSATIDDKEVELIQVNYVLRGLNVPAGKHTIKMKMVNQSYVVGNRISLACSGIIYLSFVLAIFYSFKPKKKKFNSK